MIQGTLSKVHGAWETNKNAEGWHGQTGLVCPWFTGFRIKGGTDKRGVFVRGSRSSDVGINTDKFRLSVAPTALNDQCLDAQ
jgi:hypothetical protein